MPLQRHNPRHPPSHGPHPQPQLLPTGESLANVDVASVSLDPLDSAIATLDIDGDPPATDAAHPSSASAGVESNATPGDDTNSGPPAASSVDRYRVVRVAGTGSGIPEGSAAADIGPATRDAYAAALHGCKTILWTGPLGACEGPSFAGGTLAVAQAIAAETAAGATSIVGGAPHCTGLHLCSLCIMCSLLTVATTHRANGGCSSKTPFF